MRKIEEMEDKKRKNEGNAKKGNIKKIKEKVEHSGEKYRSKIIKQERL